MSATPMIRAWLTAAALALGGHAAANQPLLIDQPLQLSLPGQTLSNAVFLDVPDAAERLHLRFDATDPEQNIVMLVRFGAPFPLAPEGTSTDVDWLLGHAHYLSMSRGGSESIVITRAGHQPLRSGRWHFSLLNLSQQTADASLRATLGAADEYVPIKMVFDDTRNGCGVSGWNDSSARQPEGGNSGTTLGQQRRLAMLEAARILSEELRPNAEIRVRACWGEIEPLGWASPWYFMVDDPGAVIGEYESIVQVNAPYLAERHVVQAIASAVHQAGSSSCRLTMQSCANPAPDVWTEFNLSIDSGANPNLHFDYGFVHSGSTSRPSFLSVALHEIAHGLGFLGQIANPAGQQRTNFGARYDDAYGVHARWVLGAQEHELLRLTDAERAQALVSNDNLRFAGGRSLAHPQNPYLNFVQPTNMIRLHSPSTVAQGSTYSHLSGTNHLVVPQLMSAQIHASAPRSLGLAMAVFEDIGYHLEAKTPPAPVNVLESQYLDPARNGHGFEIRRITGIPGVDSLYFTIFYSYDANGRPEFFNAIGEVVDGVFLPARNAHGDSLVRPLYLGPGQTEADADPAFHGEVRIDFVNAARHPACHDGAAGRALDGSSAIMSWTVQGVQRQWCVQPLVAGREGVEIDFSNQWWDPSDGGWGLSVLSFPGAGGDGLGLQLYFPDANGRGRWALVQTANYLPGAELPVLYPTAGYCRTCSMPDAQQFEQIGTMSIDLRAAGEGASTISFDVTWPGPEGGRFVREDAQIEPVGTPNYR
jgi:hypothetical protein